jgi:AcrR family transcriptional regulator
MIAIAEAVAKKGYMATTIGDIVRLAHTSRRTFYEHFPDKETCFLATYDAAADLVMAVVAATVNEGGPWDERVVAGVDAYLDGLARLPAFTRVFLVEILAVGPNALARRRAVHERFAELLRSLVAEARPEHPDLRELSPAMSIAVVGGVSELVLVAVERSPAEPELAGLREAASDLVRSVLTGPDEPLATAGRAA